MGLLVAVALTLGGCSLFEGVPIDYSGTQPGNDQEKRETIFGQGGLTLFGGDSESDRKPGPGETGLAVNAFLWRAAIDTISFLPLASADPFAGVLITDWYQPPESPTERFKVNVYVLERQLRADGVRATVFRQRLHPSGNWIDAPVNASTGTDLENAILTRARELRIASAQK